MVRFTGRNVELINPRTQGTLLWLLVDAEDDTLCRSNLVSPRHVNISPIRFSETLNFTHEATPLPARRLDGGTALR